MAQTPPSAQAAPHPLTLLRAQRGMSLRKLEKKTRVSRTTLARVEAGTVKPTFPTLLAIAAGLDCDVELLEDLLRSGESD